MKKLSVLRAEARTKLRGKWVDAVAFEILWLAIMGLLAHLIKQSFFTGAIFSLGGFRGGSLISFFSLVSMMVFFAITIAIMGPMHYVSALYYTRLINGKKADLSVFRSIGHRFARNLAVTVYQIIFTIILTFVATMIVICVGNLSSASVEDAMMTCYVAEGMWIAISLIVGLYFSQVWFHIADNPAVDAWIAVKRSALMMCNHEGYFMLLCLSFVGWFIVALLPLGLGLVVVMPYFMVTKALFYQSIRPNIVSNIKEIGAKVKKSVARSARNVRRARRA
ncbi:DUF975 family protein [bacterium]|nr:DUF975 family protein [bacterium]